MKFDQSAESTLVNNVLSHLVSDAEDLVHYDQPSAGKFDSSIVISLWLGRDQWIANGLSI